MLICKNNMYVWCLMSLLYFNLFQYHKSHANFHISIVNKFTSTINNIYQNINEEIKYRRSSINQYRDQINNKIQNTLEKFKKDRYEESLIAIKDVNNRINKFQELYKQALQSLEKQKQDLSEFNELLNKYELARHINNLDESLDQFKQFYDKTIDNLTKTTNRTIDSDWWIKLQQKILLPNTSKIELNNRNNVNNLINNWEKIIIYTLDNTKKMESVSNKTINDFMKLQDDLYNQAKNYFNITQTRIKNENKLKVLIKTEKILFDKYLQNLDSSQIFTLIDSQIKQMEVIFRNIQDKIQLTNSTYENLISKRKNSLYHSYMNDATLDKVLKLIDSNDKGWQLIRSEDGINVYRKFTGNRYACVKCHAIINSSLANVYSLFEDDSRVREYNTLVEFTRDLEMVAENTKVVWTGSPPIFPFKARDFCTIVHHRRLKDGTIIVLNRPYYHPNAPVSSKYVRASIILGANIMQPIRNQPNKCKLTMLTQVDPGGFAPPMIVNRISSFGPIGFIRNVEAASKKKRKHKQKPNNGFTILATN